VAIGVRVGYLADVQDAPDMASPILDSNWNRTQAMRIAGGEWLPDGPFWRPPGYQYFLAPLFVLGDGNLLVARIVQVVLSGLVCGLIYLIGRRAFSHGTGLLAGGIACIYQMFIYFSAELLSTTLEVFANALLLYLLLRAEEKRHWIHWGVAGVVLGAATIIRPTVLVFGIVLLLFVKGLKSWRRNWGPALALALGASLAILPVTGINLFHGKDTVAIAWQGGVNFYIGNSPYADGKTVLLRGTYEQEYAQTLGEYRDQVHLMSVAMAEQETGRSLKPSEIDRFWYGKALRTATDDPGHFAALLLRKLYYYWNTYEASNNRNIDLFLRQHCGWLRTPLPWFGLVAPLGLLGLVVSWKRGRQSRLLALFLGAQMFAVLLFFVCARFRMSALVALVVFAGAGVVWLIGKLRQGDWMRAGLAGLLLVVLLWFSHTDYWDVRGVSNASMHHFNHAIALTREGRFDEAAGLLKLVTEMKPYDPMIHCALGSTLLQADRYEDATDAYERALRIQPSLGAIIHSDLGTYLASRGATEEAEAEFLAALKVDPGFIHARLNLASLLSNGGRPEEALPHFEEVLRRAPNEASRVLTEMAVTLDRLGRRQEAIEAATESVARDGTNARAHALLAGYLEEEGDREGARREWELVKKWATDVATRQDAEDHLAALEK
jgi:Flp pilus assembly protein TadD/4-amino-4-deoxy-L-arabinose transferase-like glycosyltransferase